MDRRPEALPPTGATVVLAVVLALGACAIALGIALSVVEPQPYPVATGITGAQRQGAETALYVFSFVLALPVAALLGPRIASAVWESPNRHALGPLAATLVASLMAAMAAIRLARYLGVGGGSVTLLLAAAVWALAVGAVLARASRPAPWTPALWLADHAGWSWAVAATAVVLGTALVMRPASFSAAGGLILAVGAAGAVALTGRGWRPLPRGVARAGEAVAVLLLLLAVPDLVVVSPEDPGASATQRLIASVIQFHADFLGGPGGQVLGGGTMLVDTSSQYGVASIYSVSAWFKLLSPGYGTLSLYDAVGTAGFFGACYATLRLARTPALVALTTLAVAVVVLVFNRLYPVGALLQDGPLRFGLPILVVLTTTAGARLERWRGLAALATAAVVGLSSLWALEAFAYTCFTLAAVVAVEASLAGPGDRIATVWRRVLPAVVAGLVLHLALALLTLARAGELPDWWQYLDQVRAFLSGEIGEFNYDFSPWSPALAVGAAYLAAGCALVLLVRARPDLVRRELPAFTALAGLTAYGIAAFSYFVNRSTDHVLVYVSAAALFMCGIWLAVALRAATNRAIARGAVAFALGLALVPVSVAWSSVGTALDRSALGHLVPGGASPGAALDRLRDFPAFDRRAPAAERLVDRWFPGQTRVPVVLASSLGNEVLLRSGRTSALDIANPTGESYVPGPRLPVIRHAISELRPGSRILLDAETLKTVRTAPADPGDDALRRGPGVGVELVQTYALDQIARRFRVTPVYTDRFGFVVARLDRKR